MLFKIEFKLLKNEFISRSTQIYYTNYEPWKGRRNNVKSKKFSICISFPHAALILN